MCKLRKLHSCQVSEVHSVRFESDLAPEEALRESRLKSFDSLKDRVSLTFE